MDHWRAVLPLPLLTVRLSDWVDDFPGTLGRVLDFLDLPYDDACEQFHKQERKVRTASADQVRQPINARGIGRWRAFAEYLTPLIDELKPRARSRMKPAMRDLVNARPVWSQLTDRRGAEDDEPPTDRSTLRARLRL